MGRGRDGERRTSLLSDTGWRRTGFLTPGTPVVSDKGNLRVRIRHRRVQGWTEEVVRRGTPWVRGLRCLREGRPCLGSRTIVPDLSSRYFEVGFPFVVGGRGRDEGFTSGLRRRVSLGTGRGRNSLRPLCHSPESGRVRCRVGMLSVRSCYWVL